MYMLLAFLIYYLRRAILVLTEGELNNLRLVFYIRINVVYEIIVYWGSLTP